MDEKDFCWDVSLSKWAKASLFELCRGGPWREFEGEAKFRRNSYKVTVFILYLKAVWYGMVTFDKVGNVDKP